MITVSSSRCRDQCVLNDVLLFQFPLDSGDLHNVNLVQSPEVNIHLYSQSQDYVLESSVFQESVSASSSIWCVIAIPYMILGSEQ